MKRGPGAAMGNVEQVCGLDGANDEEEVERRLACGEGDRLTGEDRNWTTSNAQQQLRREPRVACVVLGSVTLQFY